MALILAATHKGADCNYHKIMQIDALSAVDITVVKVGLYVSAEAREAGIDNLMRTHKFTLSGLDKTRADVYAELKALSEFDGAEDA